MATASATARPTVTMPVTSASGATADALHDFLVSACAAFEPALACARPVVQLDASPPQLHEECSHEHALGFLFADEMKVARQLHVKYEEGKDLFTKVYFARGCARAIPPAPPSATDAVDVARQLRYYAGVYDVLQLQVAKLRMLCDYSTQTVGILSDTIQRIAAQENTHRVIPDVLLDSILDVMDVVLQMNQLHDAKSSLRNDFSLFKRAFNHVKGDVSDPESVAKDIQTLQEFVGTAAQSKNAIWDSLRHNLTSVKRYTQVVFLLVKQCLGHLESGRCLQPHEKFKYIRLLPCLMAVLNANPIDGNLSTFQAAEKKLIEATGKVVGRYPVVPIFADLCLRPMISVSELHGKSKVDLSFTPTRVRDLAYDLRRTAQLARKDAADFLPRLMFAINKTCRRKGQSSDDALPASIASLVIEGVRHLSEWRMSVNLFLSAKYQQPKTDDQLEHIGVSLESPYIEYQRVITHNFDPEECAAVADIIHTIKTVAKVFRHHCVRIKSSNRTYMYSSVQRFIQHTLVAIMHRADKKKHVSVKILQELRSMSGDWMRDDAPAEDFKKRRRERQLPELRNRPVPPTRSQLQMLRTAVNAIYAKKTSGDLDSKASMFTFHRELKSTDVGKLHEFYVHSADFCVLIDFDQIVEDLCFFPEMLFREQFLEITKSPQLPVDDSLPWLILNRSVMEGTQGFDVGTVLSLLEVYDDAADFVLRRAEQVAVADEVFAEAKLFFDHLIFLIGNYVFSAAKSHVARSFLGPDCLSRLRGSNDVSLQDKKVSGYDIVRNLRAIVAATCLMFQGEPQDVMLLVSGHLNARFMRDMRSTMSRLCRADATIYVAAVDLIDVLKQAHGLLTEYFVMDSFQELWLEASTKPMGARPKRTGAGPAREEQKLQRMVLMTVTQDLAAKYGYNERTRRFYPTPLPLELRSSVSKARAVDSERWMNLSDTAASSSKRLLDVVGLSRDCRIGFELKHQPYRSFIGFEHIKAMMSLLSQADIVELVDDCLDLVTTQIEEVVHLFVPVLGSAIPPYRLPRLLYRTEGCYGYFESKFRHMMESKELEAHVFHCLRIIGNALLTIQCLDQVANSAAPTTQDEYDSRSLFGRALQRLHAFLVDTNLIRQWGAEASTNPEQVSKSPSTFFLVWNALEYLSCCPPRHGTASCYREAFGEGIFFAGCTLIHLLGQRSHYDIWNPSQHVIDAHNYDMARNVATVAMQHAMKGRRPLVNALPSSPTSAQVVGTLDPEMVASASHFVAQATQMRQTARHFFSLLETSWTPVPDPAEAKSRVDFVAPT